MGDSGKGRKRATEEERKVGQRSEGVKLGKGTEKSTEQRTREAGVPQKL